MSLSVPQTYSRVIFAKRPENKYEPYEAFKVEENLDSSSLTPLKDNNVLVKVIYASIDPAMRTWLDDARSYIEPVQIGDVMRAGGIAQVLQAGPKVSTLTVGDYVSGYTGWTELAVASEKAFQKIDVPQNARLIDFIGPIGMTGQTAYWGMMDALHIDKIKPGQVLVVSGAAGATGSVACQIGKIYGAKVIALAGTPDKCKWLKEEIGVDVVLNYKDSDFKKKFVEATTDYVNYYFDNVGGGILDLVLSRLALNARIALCGAISSYDGSIEPIYGHSQIVRNRATIQGFLVLDYASRMHEANEALSKWVSEGKIQAKYTVKKGIKVAPQALQELLVGVNTGKMTVQVSDPVTHKGNL